MKKLIKGFFSMAFALASSAALANVWTDCEAWYYGGIDVNGNGFFDNNLKEFVDIRHRSDTTRYTHNAARYVNTGIPPCYAFTNEAVTSASSGLTFIQRGVFLDPIDDTQTYRSGIRLPNRITATGNIDAGAGWSIISNATYTALLRFRQNDDYPGDTAKNGRCYLINFGTGQDGKGVVENYKLDGKRHGLMLRIGNSSSDNQLYVQEKETVRGTGLYLTNSVISAKENVWTELAVVASGKTIKFCLIQPGCTPVWQNYTLVENVDGMPIVDGIYLGYYYGAGTYFKGTFNMAAFWNRALTENEIVEAFSAGAPNLVQLGGDDAGYEMFTSANNSVTIKPAAAQDFSSVPATLSEGATLNLQYELRSYSTNLAQALRVALHSGSGTFAVKIDETDIGTVYARVGQAGMMKIPGTCFAAAGDHTLSLVYSGTGAVLDEVSLGGAWRLGVEDNSSGEFGAFRSKRNVGATASGAGDEEVSGKMDASVAALSNTLNYKKNVNNPGGNPDQDGKFQRLHFNVPAEMKERSKLKLTVKLTSSTPSSVSGFTDWDIRIMVNGVTRYVKKAKQTDGSGLSHVLPLDRSWLVAGENIVEIRPDHDVNNDPTKGASMTFDCFTMEVERVSKLTGLMMIFR